MIAQLPVTQAMVKLITGATGHPCGHGALPTDAAGAPVPPPYYVLHPVQFTPDGAPLADMAEDASLIYQVTCVGVQTDQGESLADRVRAAVLGRSPVTGVWQHPLTVPGVTCYGRSIDLDAGTVPDPADAIVSYVIRFRIDCTPTT